MVHSDWGDWLLRAVESADPDGLALWYLGCNGFVVKSSGGTTIFVDPYLGTGDPPRTIRMIPVPFDPADVRSADAVLATHEHTDHVHGPSQAPILERTSATFVGPGESTEIARSEWIDSWGVVSDQIETVAGGDTVAVGDIEISVHEANDPDAEEPVAYVFEHDAGTFVHGGDARPGGFEMIGSNYDVDLAALAFGSVGTILDKESREPKRTKWYNDENELVAAAGELQADTVVPTHWDMWKGLTAEPTAIYSHARSRTYPRDLCILEIGDRSDLS
jgi:L-ascorbate 6-phosphate lactonase